MNGYKEHMNNEADIGSGEKTPDQEDTEKILEQIGKKESGESGKSGPEQGSQKDKKDEKKK